MSRAVSFIPILLFTLILIPVSASAQSGFAVLSDGSDDQLYTIDLETGDATPIGPTGFNDIECLTFNLTGDTLFGVNDGEEEDVLVTCNPDTGACNEVGPLGVSGGECGLAFDCNGNLFLGAPGEEGGFFYSVNPETGQATEIGPQGEDVTGMTARLGDAACPSGVFGLGVSLGESDSAGLGCMDITTGEFLLIGLLENVDLSCGGMDFDENGQVLWA